MKAIQDSAEQVKDGVVVKSVGCFGCRMSIWAMAASDRTMSGQLVACLLVDERGLARRWR